MTDGYIHSFDTGIMMNAYMSIYLCSVKIV